MDVTPPLQIRVETPPTPRHGPLHDHYPNASRHSARLADKRRHLETKSPDPGSPVKSRSNRSALVSTPTSSRYSSRHSANNNLSPPSSYRDSPKRRNTRRVHIVSPDSPLDNTSGGSGKASQLPTNPSHQSHPTLLTATSTSTGMLPTPVKTPKKKKVAPKVNAPARTLFDNQPIIGEEVEVPPKRGRKGRKYNGFSLDSFTAEDDGNKAQIQIFTDSKERVPELDLNDDNPFIDHTAFERGSSSKKAGGPSRRRKISAERKKDKDVEEAIRKEEGMVYVFRGRKIYRKFNEEDDAEEAAESPIDVSDLELLGQSSDPARPSPTRMRKIRPLTRQSVKPTRLFQSEKKARERAAEKEDEISTDVEEDASSSSAAADSMPAARIQSEAGTPLSPGRTLRSDSTTKANIESDDEKRSEVGKKKGRRSSPFDSWKRVKKVAGETTSSSTPTSAKGKKRDLDEANELPMGKKPKT